jgi:catechol 2,3-dioxygenase-like lactoylglutathione lyase family enzyme
VRLQGVLETALYHDTGERERMEGFYGGLLELPLVTRWPYGMAFRLGAGVVLLFDRELITERDDPPAQHGTSGPGHVCFIVRGEDYAAWKERIADAGVEVTHEHEWDGARRSFYFKDPAGNLVEIADGDLWPSAP